MIDKGEFDLISGDWLISCANARTWARSCSGEAIYIISSGEVEVFFKNDAGERAILEVATRGDFFVELSMLDQAGRSESVVTTEETETLRLEGSALEKFLKAHPQAAMDLLAAMGRRLRAAAERLKRTVTRHVHKEHELQSTPLEKAADWVAGFAGSIPFLLIHIVWFGLWLGLIVVPVPGIPQFDPYPFGFLVLTVSLEARWC